MKYAFSSHLEAERPTSEPLILPDRRRHKRHALTLLGRFMRASKDEFPCKMIDISIGGIAVMAPAKVTLGERIVAYFDLIGGLEGHVVRVFEGGFAVELSISQHKREKLAAQITWLINRDELGAQDERRHMRMQVHKSTTLRIGDGQETAVRILNISISGTSIATEARPPVGTEVMLGKLRARVVRHHVDGISLQFVDIQKPEAVRRYFG